ncbi:hypothetical protein QCA50_012124 [Cerrena zonata]|uniref:Uncharacterized protein n=1 Tax=Cerrena zonata TaxID=2478898 RepID=A0AAW0G175_9APHY
MSIKILVVNPNSSQKVSDNLAKILSAPPLVEFTFYTGPASAPKEINGTQTSIESEQVVLPDLLDKNVIEKYDGKHTKKPILGIMQATLLYSLLNPSLHKLFILTSVSEWEPLLDQAIIDFIGTSLEFPTKKFQKTKALNVSVLDLSNEEEFAKIKNKVDHFVNVEYANDHIDCILLGCAGMAGLDSKLSQAFPQIQFIDSVKVGVEFLTSIIRFNKENILS